MSKNVGAVISESLFKLLEEEMHEQGYLSISETVRVILREHFKEKEHEKPTHNTPAERLQPA